MKANGEFRNLIRLIASSTVLVRVLAAEDSAVDFAAETLFSSDIRLAQASLAGRVNQGSLSSQVSIVGASMDLDFQPAAFDLPLILPASVNQLRFSGLVDFQWQFARRLTGLGSVGGYSGFTGYRSAWIAEYYRQQTAGVPGHVRPDPSGANGSAGVRWEYLPTAGILETTVGYSRDKIAPSYDDVIDPEEGLIGYRPFRSDLNTINWRVRAENVLSKRVRTAVEFRFTSQSLRGPRLAVLGWLNFAATAHLTLRAEGGYATERFELAEPQPGDPPPTSTRFQGWWLGGTADYQLGRGWSVFATGRHYRDNGEIETSLSFSSASPGIRTWQGEAGFRWVSDRHSIKLSGGPYFTDYFAVPFNISAFGPLYRDRNFGFLQLAYQYRL